MKILINSFTSALIFKLFSRPFSRLFKSNRKEFCQKKPYFKRLTFFKLTQKVKNLFWVKDQGQAYIIWKRPDQAYIIWEDVCSFVENLLTKML